MTHTEFRQRLAGLGLSLGRFAELTGVHIVTASYWGRVRPDRGQQAMPAWVPLLLSAWEVTGAPEA